jgi:HD-GYP domain-containing protein (c-di-GMP phosphodiesterase class II)
MGNDFQERETPLQPELTTCAPGIAPQTDEVEKLRRQVHVITQEANRLSESLLHSFEELNLLYVLADPLQPNRAMEKTAELAVNSVREVTEAVGAGLYVQESNTSWRPLHVGSESRPVELFLRSPLAITWAEHVCRERKPVTVCAGQSTNGYPSLAFGIEHLIGSPLRLQMGMAAMLACNRVRNEAFTPREVGLLMAACVQASASLENALLFRELEETFHGSVSALAAAIDAHSRWTAGHSHRVTDYAVRLAGQLAVTTEYRDKVRLAGLLHDIGKISVPQLILDKDGKLTDEEFELVKRHPADGHRILGGIRSFRGDIIDGVLTHHERYDGRGYPLGCAGEEIPFMGRLLAVADAFDAMTSHRPYRRGMSLERATEVLLTGKAVQWDPQMVNAFVEIVHEVAETEAAPEALADLLTSPRPPSPQCNGTHGTATNGGRPRLSYALLRPYLGG